MELAFTKTGKGVIATSRYYEISKHILRGRELMKVLRVLQIHCDSCGEYMRTIDVELKDVDRELEKEHYHKTCSEILDYAVRQMNETEN